MTGSVQGSPYRVAAPRPVEVEVPATVPPTPTLIRLDRDGIDYRFVNAPLWTVGETLPSARVYRAPGVSEVDADQEADRATLIAMLDVFLGVGLTIALLTGEDVRMVAFYGFLGTALVSLWELIERGSDEEYEPALPVLPYVRLGVGLLFLYAGGVRLAFVVAVLLLGVAAVVAVVGAVFAALFFGGNWLVRAWRGRTTRSEGVQTVSRLDVAS